jgi:hypothetical protein
MALRSVPWLLACTCAQSYELVQTLSVPWGAQPLDGFGWSLAMSSSALAVGAAGAGGGEGAIYAFATSSGPGLPWASSGAPLKPVAGNPYGFGGAAYGANLALAMNASVLVSGVFTSMESEGGSVVFASTSAGWNLIQGVNESTPGDMLGAACAITSDSRWLLLGAPNRGTMGQVAAYARASVIAPYVGQKMLSPADFHGASADASAFGSSLALSGAVLAVGATDASGGGCVYVYRRQAGGGWLAHQRLEPSPSAPGDGFGFSVAVAGATLIAGAPYTGAGAGSAFVFSAARDGGWLQKQRLGAGQVTASFGWAVALSADETTAAVGCNSGDRAAVSVFSSVSPGLFASSVVLVSNSSGDYFGMAVVVGDDGSTVVVGAPGWYGGRGSALVFTAVPSGGGGGPGAHDNLNLAAAVAGAASGVLVAVTLAALCWARLRAPREGAEEAEKDEGEERGYEELREGVAPAAGSSSLLRSALRGQLTPVAEEEGLP